MPIPIPSTDEIDFIIETKLMSGEDYACDLLNTEIEAARQALADSAVTSSSALGHSATVDPEIARANLNTLLLARKTCQARAAAKEAELSEQQIADAQPFENPMARSFDFSGRRLL